MKTLTSFLIARLACAAVLSVTAACSGAGNAPATAPVPTPAPAPAPAPNPIPVPVASTPPLKAAAKPAAGNLLQQIKAEIGDAACDTSQQCKSLPVGSRACGGPETYLPWSTKRSNGEKLTRLADQHSNQRKEQDTKAGMISTCQMISDPGATCNAGRCVPSNGVSPSM